MSIKNNRINCRGFECFDKSNDPIIAESDFAEQCPNFDIYPTILKHKRRVIAIGDIHGDMNLAINFLKVAKVIEEINPQTEFANKRIKYHKHVVKLHNIN